MTRTKIKLVPVKESKAVLVYRITCYRDDGKLDGTQKAFNAGLKTALKYQN